MSDLWCTDGSRLRVHIGTNDRVHIKVDTSEYCVNISGDNIQRRVDLKLSNCLGHTPMPKARPLTPTPYHNHPRCPPSNDVRRRIHSSNEKEEATNDIPKIQSINKMPPNWKCNQQQTLNEQLIYRNFRVCSTTKEYSVISSLVDPVRVTSVEQIANPTLWTQFDQKRREMVKSKSDDAAALTDIGLSKQELKIALQYAKNFPLHPKVASVPYNDNMNLLFHCTRNKENIESILTSGLDERIGSGGLLGRGIYFTDNPQKSMMYDTCGVIFIFGVLLGDCLSMNQNRQRDLVREPAKVDDQKRNFNDLFFDSIVGRPGGNDNEFVIYNRHQCIPLYMVKYKKPSGLQKSFVGNFDYMEARRDLPSFCWKLASERSTVPMPSLQRLKNNIWPFYSNKIFGKMGVLD